MLTSPLDFLLPIPSVNPLPPISVVVLVVLCPVVGAVTQRNNNAWRVSRESIFLFPPVLQYSSSSI